VHPLVGNIAYPLLKVSFQGRPTLEPPPGNGILLRVADTALILTLGARPIRRAGARPKTPMLGEGVQPGIELDLPGQPVVTSD